MSTRLQIPVSADLAEIATGVIDSGPWEGRKATIKLFSGYASKGYRSNYERVPHVWIEVLVEGERRQAVGFSGRNIEFARQSFAKSKADITEALGA